MASLLTSFSRAVSRVGSAVERARVRVSAFYGQGLRFFYNALKGDYAMFPVRAEEDTSGSPISFVAPPITPITPGKVLAYIALGPVSPAVWGIIFACVAHNIRATLEWTKYQLNGVHETDHHPFQRHPKPRSAAWRAAITMMSFPGAFLGMALGAVVTTLYVNLAAIPYMIAGMGRLALKGRLVGTYQDHIRPGFRHVLGFPGTLVGFVIGLIPFTVLGYARIIKHTALSLIEAIQIPVQIMISAWRVTRDTDSRSTALSTGRFTWDQAHENMLRHGHPNNRRKRHPHEAYLLGFPGVVIGAVLGAIPAVVTFIAGTFRFFAPSFMFSFRAVYNAAAAESLSEREAREEGDRDYRIHTKLAADRYTAFQRYGYGWLGILAGSVVGTIVAVPTIILRTVINSVRLFVSTAEGLIFMTFGFKPTDESWGFNPKNLSPKRWVLGLPGLLLAGLLVGIPCLAIKGVEYALTLAVMAVSFVFIFPVRVVRQTNRWLAKEMTFHEANKAAHPIIENIMHDVLANGIDAGGELVTGAEIAELDDAHRAEPHYTFGFLKNLGKLLRKSVSLDQRTEIEEAAHAILRELRSMSSESSSLLSVNHLLVVTHAVRECQDAEKSKWFRNRFEQKQIIAELEALGVLVCERILKAIGDEQCGVERDVRSSYYMYAESVQERPFCPFKVLRTETDETRGAVIPPDWVTRAHYGQFFYVGRGDRRPDVIEPLLQRPVKCS